MLRRLLACLLILCLAAPALAVSQHCQSEAEATSADAVHHGHHKPEQPAPKPAGAAAHDCIGCIAPYSDGLRLSARPFVFVAEPVAGITDQLSGFAVQPALPPPRA